MKLITETSHDIQYKVLEEDEGKPRQHFIEGIFMQGDIKNQNGRIYPSQILRKECARFMNEEISDGRAYSELGHPSSHQINLDRVAAMIKSLRFEGNNIVGKAKLMDTPCGQIAKNLIDEGAKLGVSSRGLGSLRPTREGINEVQDDFRLFAVDIVSHPSAPDAFVRGIMEGVEFVWDNGVIKEQHIDRMKRTIESTPSRRLFETKLRLFDEFMQKLND